MKDIQNLADTRNINIKKVGIKSLSYPIVLRDRSQQVQHTIATVNMYVNLPHQFKGTHMSRFLEILNGFHDDFYLSDFPLFLREVKKRLTAEESHIELSFPYFFLNTKNAEKGVRQCYHCNLHGVFTHVTDFLLTINIPIVFSQKSSTIRTEITVRFLRFCWLEDIIEQVEKAIARDNVACSGNLSKEKAAAAIATQLETIKELRSFSVTTYDDNDLYSTFSRIESCDLRKSADETASQER